MSTSTNSEADLWLIRDYDTKIVTIRIKAKFYNSLICAHNPTEEKNDGAKNTFYAKQLQQKKWHTRKPCSLPLHEPLSRTIERRKGNREQERREREETEMHRCRNDALKLYQKVKRLTDGYKPGASSCKGEYGNLVADPRGILRLWRKHFNPLLQGDDDTNTVFRDVVPKSIEDDVVEIPPPSHEKVKVAITRL